MRLERDGALARMIGDLTRLQLVERISLRGLPRHAVGEMLRALSEQDPPPDMANLIYFKTEGNPFFVEELFRELKERGKLFDSDGQFRHDLKLEDIDLPQSVRLVIGRRMARLNPETQKILGVAAVIGRSFTFELLEASTRLEADQLLDSVEEAENAGVIFLDARISTGPIPVRARAHLPRCDRRVFRTAAPATTSTLPKRLSDSTRTARGSRQQSRPPSVTSRAGRRRGQDRALSRNCGPQRARPKRVRRRAPASGQGARPAQAAARVGRPHPARAGHSDGLRSRAVRDQRLVRP